jgi:hypothetical protein
MYHRLQIHFLKPNQLNETIFFFEKTTISQPHQEFPVLNENQWFITVLTKARHFPCIIPFSKAHIYLILTDFTMCKRGKQG